MEGFGREIHSWKKQKTRNHSERWGRPTFGSELTKAADDDNGKSEKTNVNLLLTTAVRPAAIFIGYGCSKRDFDPCTAKPVLFLFIPILTKAAAVEDNNDEKSKETNANLWFSTISRPSTIFIGYGCSKRDFDPCTAKPVLFLFLPIPLELLPPKNH